MYAWLNQPMTYNQSVLEHVDNGTDGSLFLTCIGTCKLFRLLQNYKLPADCYTTDRMYAWLYQSVTNQSVLEHVDNGDGLILPNAGNTQLCFICKLRYQPFVVRALLLYIWRVLTKKSLRSLHTQRTTEVSLSKQPHQLWRQMWDRETNIHFCMYISLDHLPIEASIRVSLCRN